MQRIARYIEPNHATRMPTRFLYLDSEAWRARNRRREVQTFRLAVTAYDVRNGADNTWSEREWGEHHSTAELWDYITSKVRTKYRTIVVAHNLAYDLRLCNALHELAERGFECQWIRIGGQNTMGSWRNGARSVMLIDSLSWINRPLADIGRMIGLPKLDLPVDSDSDAVWLERCRRDVEILATAMRSTMQWVKDYDLGNWKPTGAGQSMAAFRHRFMRERIPINRDAAARAAEVDAAHTGRCEAWRYGRITGGPFYEWDYTAAYARIGAECIVPTRCKYELSPKAFPHALQRPAQWATLAEVTVSTDVPTVPCKYEGRIIWPTGTFRTTLWDNELRLAIEHGATVEMHRAWRYQRTPALQDFCRWCLDVIDNRDHEHTALTQAIVKHWSRALIGRFAMQTSSWDQVGEFPWYDISLGRMFDKGSGERSAVMHLGTQMLVQSEVELAETAVPCIMSWIMAESRIRLWRAALIAGSENVAYMDTDSLIVDRHGHERLQAAGIPGLRVKNAARSLDIIGPRRYVMNGRLRAAGVPSGAVRTSWRTWETEVWQGLASSLQSGRADRIVITPRTITLQDSDARRQRAARGGSKPRRIKVA